MTPKRKASTGLRGLSQQASGDLPLGSQPLGSQPLGSQPRSQTVLPAKKAASPAQKGKKAAAAEAGGGGSASPKAVAMATTVAEGESAGSKAAGGRTPRTRIVPGGRAVAKAPPPIALPPATQPLAAVAVTLAAAPAAEAKPAEAEVEAAQEPEPFFNPFLKSSYAKPGHKCSEEGGDGAASQQAGAKRRKLKPELVDEAELSPPPHPMPVGVLLCLFSRVY